MSIELWREIAAELNLTYEFREMDLAGILKSLRERTADVAVAAITVTQLKAAVQGPEDLAKVRVASVADTTSSRYLERRGVSFRPFPTVSQALQALGQGTTDAVVYDGPILRYLANAELTSPVRVLPTLFERQDYAIALVEDSPYRERINRILLQKIGDSWWEEVLRRYLGI